ncbi:disease resistance protein RUN1-like [Telopea speciosissima]|uniref:disease resistance protein RUN1-like n=1 Tax=Telopea speciosissima TaxID=54955 RepID=UPI001CC76876|nr:disease resistance protein RUN1-like [Telopea speciosissima]
MEAIKDSRIAIIIFSEKYACSTWCLSELAKIVECYEDGRMEKAMPVFYKVEPSDVRHQRNTYEKTFKKHEKRFKKEMGKVKTWRAALTKTANLSGWDLKNVANGHEGKLIQLIAKDVLTIVNPKYLKVAEYPTGLDSHIENLCCLVSDGGSDVVHIIGIYGSSGIGKTTIAKAVYNDMLTEFQSCSFLFSVRSVVLSQQNGLAGLQKQLISDVLKIDVIGIDNEDQGIIFIKERLRHRRVLIVLDDIEESEQFYKLVGGCGSFGPGSRIIVTTRDKHLLKKLKVDEKYKYRVDTMNQNESLELFSCHAFGQRHPLEDYVQLSEDVIHYAGGLPLALVILGSRLNQRSQVEWERELEKLSNIPNDRILEALEISYNALDKFDQSMFLDISCFLIGKDKDKATKILEACGRGGEVGIKLLTERSLVTIDEGNKLCMHELNRDMVREIVRRQSPQKPGERSRLWDLDDALDVMINLTGTDAIEGLQLDLWKHRGEVRLTTAGFSKMHNLILLEVDSEGATTKIHPETSQQECFRYLACFRWKGFPLEYIPNDFHLGNLVILDMQYSKLKKVWKVTKVCDNFVQFSFVFDLFFFFFFQSYIICGN